MSRNPSLPRSILCPLSAACTLLLLLPALDVCAQKIQTPATIELSAVQLGNEAIPPLFYAVEEAGPDGRKTLAYREFTVSRGTRSEPVTIPFVPPVTLFTPASAAEKTEMKPFVVVPTKAPGERFLLVLHQDFKGRPHQTFLDDSTKAHPPGGIRVVNLTERRMAFSAGGANLTVPPGAEARTVPVLNAQGRFPFTCFFEGQGGEVVQSPNQALRFVSPGQRLLVLYSTQPLTDEEGGTAVYTTFHPTISRLYDAVTAAGMATGHSSADSASQAVRSGLESSSTPLVRNSLRTTVEQQQEIHATANPSVGQP